MVKKYLFILLIAVTFSSVPLYAEDIQTGWISGQMMIKDGGPMSNGMVVFFRADKGPPPNPDRYMRVPDEIAGIEEDGKFRVSLPVGKYFMGAIKRMSGESIGPPHDGDYFFIRRDIQEVPVTYLIEEGKNLSVGIIAEAVPFKLEIPEDVTGISGSILDLKNKPVAGAIVFAYVTETMTGLPPFASYRTGEDGKYFISVSNGGRYYLRVRDKYGGGPPVAGEVMGGYGEEKAAAVNVKEGKITAKIDIKVIRHFQRGPKQ